MSQPVIGQDTVFSHDRNDVRSYTDSHQIKQRHEVVEIDAIIDGKRLHELEAHTTSRKMLVRVGGIRSLGIEDGYRRGQHLVRYMVVADDEVDAFLLGIGYLIDCLDTAIQHDDELDTSLVCIIHSFHGHSITFLVSVGDVVVDVGIELLEELVDQCYGRSAIHIIVTIHQYAFLPSHSFVQTIDRDVHIPHQEGVVQLVELGTEEFLGL